MLKDTGAGLMNDERNFVNLAKKASKQLGTAKKSVILYGLKHLELQRNIEFFLDDAYEVAAFTDSYYMGAEWREKPFIPLTELGHYHFDYVLLLAYGEAALQSMRNSLLQLGVSPEKIVAPTMFLYRDAASNQVDLIAEIQRTYKGEPGIIFGMSYSMGIGKDAFSIPFYNCSWSAMDLYYNFRIFEYMTQHDLLSTVKIALLVFPHYYFTYDLSQCRNTYKTGEMFSIRRLNDWHHNAQVPSGRDYVENFHLFGEKVDAFYRPRRHENRSCRVYQGHDGAAQLTKMWFRNYEKTIAENKGVFLKFCKGLSDAGITPALVVPPVYLNGVNAESMDVFRRKKEQFQQIVLETKQTASTLDIFDYSTLFADKRDFFEDLVHLNAAGLLEFTRKIDQDILKRFEY